MARNNQLREETVSMQIQKATYDNYYWKLDESLVQQNRLLNAAVEQATEDYEQWYVALSALWAKPGAARSIQIKRLTEASERGFTTLS